MSSWEPAYRFQLRTYSWMQDDGREDYADAALHEFYCLYRPAHKLVPAKILRTQARLALDLLRFTTGRGEDAPRFGRQHIRAGRIRFRQAKNEHRNPIDIDIPVLPELAESIAAAKIGNMTFLITEFGKPFTANGFGNKFKDWCRQADLPHCSAHGLRKATATQLAEAGATAHEIMSVTGHQSLKEAERYTKAARRNRLADSALAKLKR